MVCRTITVSNSWLIYTVSVRTHCSSWTTRSSLKCERYDSYQVSLEECSMPSCIKIILFYFIHFIIPFVKFGPPYLQQLQEQHYPVLQVHVGSFCVSIIHQTPTWTTWSSTCVHDHSYACVYTQVLGTATSQHNTFDSEKLSQIFLVLRMGFELRVFESRVRHSTNWATPSPQTGWMLETAVYLQSSLRSTR